MKDADIITRTVDYVKTTLNGAEGGHDWFHIERVWKTSQDIASHEKANLLIVQLGALLHDIADSKFHNGDETIGPQLTRQFLTKLNLNREIVDSVVSIVENISFKGGNFDSDYSSKELDVVQDADRLDAIGATGIARAFNYGGHKGFSLFNPEIVPIFDMDKETYKKSKAPTVNHFFEKLLQLKDRMNTDRGKMLAQKRHDLMVVFLRTFFDEWQTNFNDEKTIKYWTTMLNSYE